jgi:DNA polymerase-1
VNDSSRRVHTSYHQTGTATGRLSSSEPNLQNIPIRTPLGAEIRKAFRAPDADTVLISADYSQIELRLLAHLAEAASLVDAFAAGEDIHRATAAKIFGVAPEAVDSDMRSRAKAINFGVIYGMGPRRLAAETGVSMAEAEAFIARYFETYPEINKYVASAIDTARRTGYSTTITGRKRPIPELQGAARHPGITANAENMAVNSPIQGSAADLIKLAMIRIDRELRERGLKTQMLMQVHDELVFECPRDEVDAARALISEAMQAAMPLRVPLDVQIGVGGDWLEAH